MPPLRNVEWNFISYVLQFLLREAFKFEYPVKVWNFPELALTLPPTLKVWKNLREGSGGCTKLKKKIFAFLDELEYSRTLEFGLKTNHPPFWKIFPYSYENEFGHFS